MNGTTGAIFIPCRGGGTATTYYTDWHDVDEEMRAIIRCRASWDWTVGSNAGVVSQTMHNPPTATGPSVASYV